MTWQTFFGPFKTKFNLNLRKYKVPKSDIPEGFYAATGTIQAVTIAKHGISCTDFSCLN
jgi:hypothetical protein